MPRPGRAPAPVETEAQKAFLESCADFVHSGEPYRILKEMANGPDDSKRAWAVDKLLAYGIGTPRARREDVGVDVGELVRLAWEGASGSTKAPRGLLTEGGPEPQTPPFLPRAREPLIRKPEAAASGFVWFDPRLEEK